MKDLFVKTALYHKIHVNSWKNEWCRSKRSFIAPYFNSALGLKENSAPGAKKTLAPESIHHRRMHIAPWQITGVHSEYIKIKTAKIVLSNISHTTLEARVNFHFKVSRATSNTTKIIYICPHTERNVRSRRYTQTLEWMCRMFFGRAYICTRVLSTYNKMCSQSIVLALIYRDELITSTWRISMPHDGFIIWISRKVTARRMRSPRFTARNNIFVGG